VGGVDMADISKCENKKCPLKEKCKRWRIPASKYQSYTDFKFTYLNGKASCPDFWEWVEYND